MTPEPKEQAVPMIYRAEFECEHDWHDEAQRKAAIAEAATKLRLMAARLEEVQGDDIMTAFDHGRGIQGWWLK